MFARTQNREIVYDMLFYLKKIVTSPVTILNFTGEFHKVALRLQKKYLKFKGGNKKWN